MEKLESKLDNLQLMQAIYENPCDSIEHHKPQEKLSFGSTSSTEASPLQLRTYSNPEDNKDHQLGGGGCASTFLKLSHLILLDNEFQKNLRAT